MLPKDANPRVARQPFSTDQLNKIIGADIYNAPRGEWDARQWTPLIALFSGLR